MSDGRAVEHFSIRRLFVSREGAKVFFYPQISQIIADYFLGAAWRRGRFFLSADYADYRRLFFWG
ncbi:MAG: hypothetical protein ACOX9E_16010, partial [Lentisphaeria bacterium]